MGSALSSPILAVAIATGFAGVLGFFLLWVGIRGRRINDHPVCQKCRFDLVGLTKPPLCPECGGDLAKPGAIRIGERRKRGRVLAIGTLLILVVGTASSVVGWGVAKGYDWNRIKPVWLLIREGGGDADLQGDAALKELLRRQAARILSTAQTREVTRAALQYQADSGKLWRPGWGDLVEVEQLAGKLTDEDFKVYIRNAVMPEYRVRSHVIVGSPIPVVLVLHARVGKHNLLACEGTRLDTSVGERTFTAFSTMSFSPSCAPIGALGYPTTHFHLSPGRSDAAIADRPGEQIAKFSFRFHVASGKWDEANRQFVFEELGVSWYDNQQRTITAVPEPGEPIELVHDATVGAAMRSAISIRGISQSSDINTWDRWHFVPDIGMPGVRTGLWMYFDFSASQYPMAFDVTLRKGDKEWPAGRIHSEAVDGWDFEHRSVHVQALDFNESTVDVVLRPSPQAARESTGIARIWGEEIVLRDVSVWQQKNPKGQ